MIKEVIQSDWQQVYELIKQDNARNYFIRLGLESQKPTYEKIIGQWDVEGRLTAILFKRLSGNLQFYARGAFDIESFATSISQLQFDSLISPRSYCDYFLDKNLFSCVKEGGFIAALHNNSAVKFEDFAEVEPLKIEDLDDVVKIYEEVFTSFSSKSVMEQRLRSGRGRGVCIRHQGRIISVVQSEFEEETSALIVGVGTAVAYQGQGLATKCLKVICSQLLQEGKDLYLQYDNMDAGRIYEKLGFRQIDQIRYYKR